MNEVFELGGNMVEEGVAFSIMRLIGEGEKLLKSNRSNSIDLNVFELQINTV